ncbi:hypothetical protein V1503_19270 [Bacillus sp. SCS-151]|uniref:hypothetical protein n=1 Tax=Nanhaiella sioensis TaxID=3115293 RepID=UPI00397CF601
MRKRTMLDLVNLKLKELNKYLGSNVQRLELIEEEAMNSEDKSWNIKWFRSIDKDTEVEEHIFGGDELDMFATLNGIEYGIRMKKTHIS